MAGEEARRTFGQARQRTAGRVSRSRVAALGLSAWLVAFTTLPDAAAAQEPTPPGAEQGSQLQEPSPGAAFIGAVVGGAVGLFVGGHLASGSDCAEICIEIFTGGLVGEILGVAAGAHLFNGGRGSFWKDLGTSAGTVAIGLIAHGLTDSEKVFLASLAGQVVAVSLVETRTSRTVSPTVGAQRTPDGVALEFGVRVR